MRNDEKQSRRFAKVLRANMTNAEVILWSRLRHHPSHKFRRQHPIGPYIADFTCITARLVVEVDGYTHGTDQQIERDRARDSYMVRRGWRVVRVLNDDIYKRLVDVLEYIDSAVKLAESAEATVVTAPSVALRAPPPP